VDKGNDEALWKVPAGALDLHGLRRSAAVSLEGLAMGGVLGGSPSLDTGGGDTYRSTLQRLGYNLGDMYNQGMSQFGTDNAALQKGATAYGQYLLSDPGTQQNNAMYTANAERFAGQGAQRATANLEQNLAARGIPINSSAGVGGLASIQQGMAENNANIQAQNAIRNQDIKQQNLGKYVDLESGLASGDYSRANNALGQQAGINQGLLSEADQLAMDKYNQEVAQQNAQAAFWGDLGSAGINAWSASKKGGN
jgi:hypothetical protein